MRATFVQFSAAIAIGAVSASAEYRVIMEGCAFLSSLWYQRLVVVIAFGALYALVMSRYGRPCMPSPRHLYYRRGPGMQVLSQRAGHL
jgi:hypothetical protein